MVLRAGDRVLRLEIGECDAERRRIYMGKRRREEISFWKVAVNHT
jgi:hypothetical protein